jgi:polysaccharide deacetylase 2 family uncharacterized protein YibQ
MEYKDLLRTHQKKLALIGIGFFLLVLVLLLVFNRTPEFSTEIPSAAQLETAQNTYHAQKKLFARYTVFIRSKHGGTIIAEEKNASESTTDVGILTPARFVHRYTSYKKQLVFDLTDTFAKQNKISYKIRSNADNKNHGNGTDYFEVEFLKDTLPWIIVEMQVIGGHVNETPAEKRYAQNTEPKLNGDENGAAPLSGDAKLVIVIDDLGNRMNMLRNLLSLDFDITYSILPQRQFSMESAEMVFDSGREVILHLPMQPKDYPKYNPGLGALLLGDEQDIIVQKLERNLETVPYAVGVNNHMGSAFTQHDMGLDAVMQVLSGRMLFFLDSKTAPGRIAKSSARDYRVPYMSRDIFLDNDIQEGAIKRQLFKAARIASRHGKAIAIGHPYLETYKALAKFLPEIETQGIRVTRVSDLLSR